MAKPCIFAVFIIIVVAALACCTSVQQVSYIRAAENGDSFFNNNCNAYLRYPANTMQISAYGVSGNLPNIVSPSIILLIAGYTGAGKYIIDSATGVGAVIMDQASNSTQHYSSYGSIVINESTPDIIGTFSFTCEDSTVVTNGSFFVHAP